MTDQQASSPAPATANQDHPSIGQVLIHAEVISKETLNRALDIQGQGDGRRLGTILIENGWLKPESLAMALSVHLNLPFIDLKRHRIRPEAVQMIPEELARRHRLIPMDIVDETLAVVMEDPTDIQVIEELQAVTGGSVKPMVGVSNDIQAAIDLNYTSNQQIVREVSSFAPSPGTAELAELTGVEPEAPDPVVRAVDLILEQAVRDRASDIHIVPDHTIVRVRSRVDGVLQETLNLPKGSHTPLLSRLKIMAGMNIAERRRAQDGQFSKYVEGEETFFRVATSDTTWGEMAALRILGRSELIYELPELGLRQESIEALRRLVRAPFGMVIVCGPTGSGKTTSLYASVNQLDREQRNVMTIEDPVEYNFPKVNQIQVNRAADITFATGLRGIMRLDPDVILVGEARDGETAEAATQAALTGHMVLTSLHANEASGALYRLNHLGVERYLIVSAVLGIVAQRLVRRVCPHCKLSREPNEEERRLFSEELDEVPEQVVKGEGCNYCGHSGYLGRTGVFEIMAMDDEIRSSFMSGSSAAEIQGVAKEMGMVTMRQDAMMKVRDGITTAEEVRRNVATLV